MSQKHKVMIVEDEYLIAEDLRARVGDFGLEVCGVAATAEGAELLAKAHRPDLVLMDVGLLGARDGVQVAETILGRLGAEVIFITGSRDPATLERIEQSGAAAVLQKPVSDTTLRDALRQVLAA